MKYVTTSKFLRAQNSVSRFHRNSILADFAGAMLTSLESAFSNEGTSIAHVGEG
jgi:hypothetical protein